MIKQEKRLVEFRAIENTEGRMIIEGYAITYEQSATHTSSGYQFTEVIKRGALDKTDMSDVLLRYNHNDNCFLMARTKNNSLQLIKDDVGLKIRAELIDTQSNKDIYKSIQEGLIDKMSFAFDVAENGDTWSYGEDKTYREVKDINRLYDVSVVDTPFYDTTSIYSRSIQLLKNNLSDPLELEKEKLLLKYKYKE